MVSKTSGQLNNVLHPSITVCDPTQKIFLKQLLTNSMYIVSIAVSSVSL